MANNNGKNESLSSVETQRKLRIEKLKKLKKLGHNPFTPESQADQKLGVIKFWFNFVHNCDIKALEKEIKPYTIEYFLYQVLLPKDILQRAEERLRLRTAVKQLGLDPDDENTLQEFYDTQLITDTRKHFIDLIKYSEEERYHLLHAYLVFSPEEQRFVGTTLKAHQKITLSGRIKSKRVSGKIAFATIEDESCPEGFQFIFKRDDLPPEPEEEKEYSPKKPKKLSFRDFKGLFEEGDYIQAKGKLDYSKTGEPSLFVEEFDVLTKALRPLPEIMEYDNFEERYLNRVVDFKMNTQDQKGLSVRDMMRLKSRFWQIWREEMLSRGFLEVETPVFENVPGGAEAKPFVTHYDLLDQDVYLRISPELNLKRLIAGGFEKVFEIGRIFRNEGASPQHLQEYTQIEWYWGYADYNDAMPMIQAIYRRIIKEVVGGTETTDYYGNKINWGSWCTPALAKKRGWELLDGWPKIPYYDAIRYFSGDKVDLEGKTYDELLQIAKENDVEIEENSGYAKVVDTIYKKTARVNMIDPFFLVLPPVEMEPLAKRDPKQPELTQRYQVVAGTAELGKGFSELNDPIDQLGRFEDQQAARDAGDEEAQFQDDDFVKTLEYGMPPTTGFGVSERLFSFLLGKGIKECVTFPAVRSQNETQKTKETLVAHAVTFDDGKQPIWKRLNATAHLTAALAARKGKQLFEFMDSESKDGEKIPMNIQHAIVMKETDNSSKLLELKRAGEEKGLDVVCFTEAMQETSNDRKVDEMQRAQNIDEIKLLGVLVFGERKAVEKLTKGFELTD